jgi:GNAT superfamily N-acetyltransferase
MDSKIQIVEKPEWVSWEEIKQCMMEAHAVNRAKGINMYHYQWPAEQIREFVGENGVMLVALDGKKVVGTAALVDKEGKAWYARGPYAYLGFDGMLPEYSGKGIYKQLWLRREEIARDKGYDVLLFDTHRKNSRVQKIGIKNGYKKVSFFRAKSGDHFNVIMVKWLNGCPYSASYCAWRFFRSKVMSYLRNAVK